MTYRKWPQLTDDEAAQVAEKLRSLDVDFTKPSEQARVHLAHDGKLLLAIWHAMPVPPTMQEVDGGETWDGYLHSTGTLHPPAEAMAILRSPSNPESEIEIRRARRAEGEARRQAAKEDRESRDRAEQIARSEQQRVYRQHGGETWDQLTPLQTALFTVVLKLEDQAAEHPELRPIAAAFRTVADACLRSLQAGERDGRLPFPGRSWQHAPGSEPPRWAGVVPSGAPSSPPP